MIRSCRHGPCGIKGIQKRKWLQADITDFNDRGLALNESVVLNDKMLKHLKVLREATAQIKRLLTAEGYPVPSRSMKTGDIRYCGCEAYQAPSCALCGNASRTLS